MSEPMNWVVGSAAAVMALGAAAAAFDRWALPFELASAKRLEGRWGKGAARGYFFLLFVLLAASAVAIFTGIRPGYATRSEGIAPSRKATGD